MTTITNNGKSNYDGTVGSEITLRFDGVENTFSIYQNTWKVVCPIAVSADYRVRVGRETDLWSDPYGSTELAGLLKGLGFEFIYQDPSAASADNVKELAWGELMAVAGYGPDTEKWEKITDTDFAFYRSGATGKTSFEKAYSVSAAIKAANKLIAEARQWIHNTFPSIQRTWNPDDFTAVEFYHDARRASIIRVKLGELAIVKKGYGNHFGSGGAWGAWRVYGNPAQESVKEKHDNGFVQSEEIGLVFSAPGAVYTAAGDAIGNGRVFYRQLVAAE